MKKLVFIITAITIFPWNMVIAQWKVKPTIGISHSLSLIGTYDNTKLPSNMQGIYGTALYHSTYAPYQITNINVGINFVHKNYSFMLSIDYQYFICKELLSGDVFRKKEVLKSSFIGLVISNRFRETKIVRPFFSIELSTEVATNYKNKYLKESDYYPDKYFTTASIPFSKDINYYQSTPFIGNLLVGCDFRLYKGLSVNAAFGYGLRILKAQYGKAYYNPSIKNTPIYEEKIGQPYSLALNYLTLQLGLSYAFDIHKKKQKAEMP